MINGLMVNGRNRQNKFPSKGGVAVERSETDGVVKTANDHPLPPPEEGNYELN